MLSTATDAPRTRSDRVVGVRAPGRLHLGFLDPAGTLGRRFGSLGLVVDGPETALELRAAERPGLSAGPDGLEAELARAEAHLLALQRATGRHAPLHLHLACALPSHAGFGSGTQLALAVGCAFARWHELPLTTPELARLLGRGRRSGIGIAGFDHGGLLVDGGPGEDGSPAPLLARVELPAAWRVLLVQDPDATGLSGDDEKQALATLPAFAQASAAAVCHEVLMRVLPGAASGDFAGFAAGVSAVQRLVGEHFAPAQGGRHFVSAAVGRLCDWIAAQQPAATGQSSWGPTGFAILPSHEAASALRAAALAAAAVDPRLRLHIVAPRAHGALVTTQGVPPDPRGAR